LVSSAGSPEPQRERTSRPEPPSARRSPRGPDIRIRRHAAAAAP
jgi:hypothetical protein